MKTHLLLLTGHTSSFVQTSTPSRISFIAFFFWMFDHTTSDLFFCIMILSTWTCQALIPTKGDKVDTFWSIPTKGDKVDTFWLFESVTPDQECQLPPSFKLKEMSLILELMDKYIGRKRCWHLQKIVPKIINLDTQKWGKVDRKKVSFPMVWEIFFVITQIAVKQPFRDSFKRV